MKKLSSILFRLVIVLFFCSTAIYSQEIRVKNVVLMIGDGMGLSHIYAAMSQSNTPLNFERFPVVGLVKTSSLNNFITDSGAAGTAMACGVKTNNKMIGMTPDFVAHKSILEIAHDAGLSTGIVVSSSVTHATPACFVAHQKHRKMTQEIALDYVNSGIDVFIGGGKGDFNSRKDNKNLSEELLNRGYQVVYSMTEIPGVKSGKLAGLIADEHPPKAADRSNMLYDATTKALELLEQNKKGFFLMIEGSQIDWASHKNNFDEMLSEVSDFDNVTGLVLDFAEKDNNTLVIVVSDHETGGLVLLDKDNSTGKIQVEFTTKEHSATPVPLFAYGPGSEVFSGIMENTSLFFRILELYQLED